MLTSGGLLPRLLSLYRRALWGSMEVLGVRDSVEQKSMAAVTIQYVAAMTVLALPVAAIGPRETLEVFPTTYLVASVVVVGLATVAYLNTIWVVRRDVVDPIVDLHDVATDIAAGDLDRTPDVQAGSDETGDLIRAMAELQSQLRDQIVGLRKFRAAVRYSGGAIFITDANGSIEYVNRTFESMTGYDEADVVGLHLTSVLADPEGETRSAELWRTVTDGEVWHGELTNYRQDGDRYVVDQTVAPIAEDGGCIGYVATSVEVTEQKRHEERLSVLNRVLRHNIRNDAQVLSGYARELGERLDGRDEQLARDIESTARDLVRIGEKARDIERLLDRTADARPVDLVDVVETVVDRARTRYPAADLSVDVPREAALEANPELLEAVVWNVVENAITYADSDRPTVEIRAHAGESTVDLSIADDGAGIPAHERTVVLEGEETALVHGSGLGLWLVRWGVRNVGGDLDITAADGRGTEVTISFPLLSTLPL